MTRYLHSLSAVLFYILGGSFFLAYVLQFNNIAAAPLLAWMHSMDLPLLCVALLYGGTSVYRSLSHDENPSRGLALSLIIPFVIIFLAAAVLKFWPTPFILNY